jgi:hypothetical protein
MDFNQWKNSLLNLKNGFYKLKLPEEFIEHLSDEDLVRFSNKIDWLDFSFSFKNLYPNRFDTIKDFIIWNTYSSRDDISLEQIVQFQEYIQFKLLSPKILTNEILENFGDKMAPATLSSLKGISDENIIRYQKKIIWGILLKHRLLSNEMIDRFAKEIFSIETHYSMENYEFFQKRYDKDGFSKVERVITRFKNKTRIAKDALNGVITKDSDLITLEKKIPKVFEDGMKAIDELKAKLNKVSKPKINKKHSKKTKGL